jgi:hypothetical protein
LPGGRITDTQTSAQVGGKRAQARFFLRVHSFARQWRQEGEETMFGADVFGAPVTGSVRAGSRLWVCLRYLLSVAETRP